MNEHEKYPELISRLLDEDRTLSPEESAALQAHVAKCPECAALYAAFSALSDAVGGDLEEPPEALRENVMAELRRAEIRRKNSPVRFSFAARGWIGTAAVAAVLALVILFSPKLGMRRADNAGMQLAASSFKAASAADAQEIREMPAAGAAIADASLAAMPAAVPEAEESAEAPAESVVMTTEQAAAAEDAEEEVSFSDVGADSAQTNAAKEESFSMVSLLALLNGRDSSLSLDLSALSPDYLIATDEGVLELYRYAGALYYLDPVGGGLREAVCSEDALIAFMQK